MFEVQERNAILINWKRLYSSVKLWFSEQYYFYNTVENTYIHSNSFIKNHIKNLFTYTKQYVKTNAMSSISVRISQTCILWCVYLNMSPLLKRRTFLLMVKCLGCIKYPHNILWDIVMLLLKKKMFSLAIEYLLRNKKNIWQSFCFVHTIRAFSDTH